MIAIFLGFALLASAMIANKVALFSFPPILFVAVRMVGAGLILLAYQWRKSERLHWRYLKIDVAMLLAISLLTTLIPSIFKAHALKHMISAKFTLFGSIDPFITALYAYVLYRERLTWSRLLGMFIGFAGLLILIFSTSFSQEHLPVFGVFSYPELAALAAPLLGRMGWMLVQKLLRRERYTAPEINGVTMLISGICAFVVSAGTESWHIECVQSPLIIISAIVYTIIVGNVIALTMYADFLKHHSATLISLAGFSVNFFVAFYGWVLLAEIPPISFFIAALVTFIGLLIFYAAELRRTVY